MKYKVIDLFAGPGGLGEGFASLNDGKAFEIVVSAEMERSAHETLTLRSFFRHIRGNSLALQGYFDFCNDENAPDPKKRFPDEWKAASDEAQRLTLGNAEDNAKLDAILDNAKLVEEETILIGGPPCQAYSLVGRSRNMGKTGYVAADDHRHFLYKEYLRILHKARPAVFVMENVKGILSSKVGGKLVFHDILRDLTDPGKALGVGTGLHYTIHSLVLPTKFEPGDDPEDIDPRDFIIKAERYGIPQSRHRVILLGVRKDAGYAGGQILQTANGVTVESALMGLPRLRSKLSHEIGVEGWCLKVKSLAKALEIDALLQGDRELANRLELRALAIRPDLETGSLRFGKREVIEGGEGFHEWVKRDSSLLKVWLNEETRSHMDADLGRYFYAATFAEIRHRSPKGHSEFMLAGLAPKHANWETGKFADRFRVQCYKAPSTTVTSHISKDGHYFIHPDPTQCRSLTVREAARLQTFPDNYFFQGNRTQQYHQVGNAVPSLLANKIARICYAILSNQCRQLLSLAIDVPRAGHNADFCSDVAVNICATPP